MKKLRKLKFVVLGGCAILILYYALLLNFAMTDNPEAFISCPDGYVVLDWEEADFVDQLCSQGYKESEYVNTFNLCKWISYAGLILVIPFILYDVYRNKNHWKEQAKKFEEVVNK